MVLNVKCLPSLKKIKDTQHYKSSSRLQTRTIYLTVEHSFPALNRDTSTGQNYFHRRPGTTYMSKLGSVRRGK